MTIRRAVSIVGVIIGIGIVASALYVVYDSSMHAEDKGAPSRPVTATLIARGEYLTRAADCAACHTAPNGKPFAGGQPFSRTLRATAPDRIAEAARSSRRELDGSKMQLDHLAARIERVRK